jgi:hypothetical protein
MLADDGGPLPAAGAGLFYPLLCLLVVLVVGVAVYGLIQLIKKGKRP